MLPRVVSSDGEHSRGDTSSVVKCPPLNWKVGCSIHGHCVNCPSFLGESVHPKSPLKGQLSGFGLPPTAVTKNSNKKNKKNIHIQLLYCSDHGVFTVFGRSMLENITRFLLKLGAHSTLPRRENGQLSDRQTCWPSCSELRCFYQSPTRNNPKSRPSKIDPIT